MRKLHENKNILS